VAAWVRWSAWAAVSAVPRGARPTARPFAGKRDGEGVHDAFDADRGGSAGQPVLVFGESEQQVALGEDGGGRGVEPLRGGVVLGCGAAGEPDQVTVTVADPEHDAVAHHIDEGAAA
jgi:hypothetical protein